MEPSSRMGPYQTASRGSRAAAPPLQVRSLLDSLPPKAQGWEAKVRDGKSCGLVKAVCEADGSFEWVEPKWKAAYEARGRSLLGLSEEELSG